jgi:hypothetical protein
MRLIILFLLVFISCKNDEIVSTKENFVKERTFLNEDKKDVFDTIFFDFENKSDFAIIKVLEKSSYQDNMSDFELEFWNNKTYITSNKIQIKNFDENSEFSGNYLDSSNPSLKLIHIGYPACAYQQNGFLFYIDKDKAQLLYQFTEFSDSGWGSYVEFFPINEKKIISRRTDFSPDENDSSIEDMGIVEYSDSISLVLKNNSWQLNQITPKDKTYRKEKKSFEDFHKQQ